MANVVHLPISRPRVRSDCESGGWNSQRPCRFERCRWNSATLAARRANKPKSGVCVLDVAEEAHTLEEVGEVLGVSREYVRQLQDSALVKLRRKGVTVGVLRVLSSHEFVHEMHPLSAIAEEA